MNTLYTIALIGFDDIDFNVMTQMIAMHHPKVNYTRDAEVEKADIVFNGTELSLIPRRAGELLDKIEYYIHQSPYQNVPNYKDYRLDWKESRLFMSNQEITLTDRERDVMAELIIAGEGGCRRDYLLNKIWGYRADLDTHAVETHIYRLRQKIECIPDSPKRLLTIEGGYCLV